MGIRQEINTALKGLCKKANSVWGYYAPAHDPAAASAASTPEAKHANLNMLKGMVTGLRDIVPETVGGISGLGAGILNSIKKFPDTFSVRRIPDNFIDGMNFVDNNFTRPAVSGLSRLTKPLARFYNAENSRLENEIMRQAGDYLVQDPKDQNRLTVNNSYVGALRDIAENRAGARFYHSAVTSIPWLFTPSKKIPIGILPYAASTWLPWSEQRYGDRQQLKAFNNELEQEADEMNEGIAEAMSRQGNAVAMSEHGK